LASICREEATAAFDVGRINSDAGVLLLAGAARRLGRVDTLAAVLPDPCDPAKIMHTMSDILGGRVLAVALSSASAKAGDHAEVDDRDGPLIVAVAGQLYQSG
jgi:hypothetical protein